MGQIFGELLSHSRGQYVQKNFNISHYIYKQSLHILYGHSLWQDLSFVTWIFDLKVWPTLKNSILDCDIETNRGSPFTQEWKIQKVTKYMN